MPVDQSYIGRVYPPTPPYEVGREKIREFASAIGDPNPLYREVEAARGAGYPDLIAPPTFAVVLTLPAGHQVVSDPDLGIDYSRGVHGEQRFVHRRVNTAGVLQELLAGLGERYAVRVTLEQLHAEALLQPLERGRNGRLRDVQVDRSLRDLTGLGGREKILDLLE